MSAADWLGQAPSTSEQTAPILLRHSARSSESENAEPYSFFGVPSFGEFEQENGHAPLEVLHKPQAASQQPLPPVQVLGPQGVPTRTAGTRCSSGFSAGAVGGNFCPESLAFAGPCAVLGRASVDSRAESGGEVLVRPHAIVMKQIATAVRRVLTNVSSRRNDRGFQVHPILVRPGVQSTCASSQLTSCTHDAPSTTRALLSCNVTDIDLAVIKARSCNAPPENHIHMESGATSDLLHHQQLQRSFSERWRSIELEWPHCRSLRACWRWGAAIQRSKSRKTPAR